MKLKTLILLLIILFSFNSVCWSLTGDSVYSKYKQNEKEIEKDIRSMIMVMETKAPEFESELTIYKKGKKMRVETKILKSQMPAYAKPGQKSIMIDDGVTITIFSPVMGKISNPSEQNNETKPDSIKYLGKETVNGINCHKIETSESYENTVLWIAEKDYILVKESSGGNMTINSDFRKVNGHRIAGKIVDYEDGSINQTSVLKSIRVNRKIDNALFNPAKVEGYSSGNKNNPVFPNQMTNQNSVNPSNQNMVDQNQLNKTMNIMQMGMEIQRLYQNGETEKAKELEKKMQMMLQGQE